jgi:LPS export ABC transporter protein LptC
MLARKIKLFALLVLIAITFCACENNLEVVSALTDPKKMPEITSTNIVVLYSDSAKVRAKITAKQSDYFASVQEPYFEFPKGMRIYFYDDSMNVKAEISANYAVYYERKQLYEARNDVVVINRKGDKLNTEQLFWDGNKHKIYSTKYCRVTDTEGYQHVGNHGLESDETFDNYQFKGASGTVPVNTGNEP